MNQRPGVADGFSACPPIALVHVSPHQEWMDGKISPHNGQSYRALIDTGAESTAIAEGVAQEIGAKLIHAGIVHGMGGSDYQAKAADIQILFPSANVIFLTRAFAQDMRAQSFDLILGRSFLKHCRFLVDGPAEMFQLFWVE